MASGLERKASKGPRAQVGVRSVHFSLRGVVWKLFLLFGLSLLTTLATLSLVVYKASGSIEKIGLALSQWEVRVDNSQLPPYFDQSQRNTKGTSIK